MTGIERQGFAVRQPASDLISRYVWVTLLMSSPAPALALPQCQIRLRLLEIAEGSPEDISTEENNEPYLLEYG